MTDPAACFKQQAADLAAGWAASEMIGLGTGSATVYAIPWVAGCLRADEVDPAMDLIKGGGDALLRERSMAQASLREMILRVGPHRALPL